MNALIVKLFVFMTEVLSVIIIGLVLLAGLVAMFTTNVFYGLAIAIGGTLLFTAFFGFAAIFIEIHKDLRALRELMEKKSPL